MQEYKIAAFRSREHTVNFYERLRAYRIDCSVVNTPREAAVGCGISVKFPPRAENTARIVLSRSNLSSFIGFFKVSETNNRRRIELL